MPSLDQETKAELEALQQQQQELEKLINMKRARLAVLAADKTLDEEFDPLVLQRIHVLNKEIAPLKELDVINGLIQKLTKTIADSREARLNLGMGTPENKEKFNTMSAHEGLLKTERTRLSEELAKLPVLSDEDRVRIPIIETELNALEAQEKAFIATVKEKRTLAVELPTLDKMRLHMTSVVEALTSHLLKKRQAGLKTISDEYAQGQQKVLEVAEEARKVILAQAREAIEDLSKIINFLQFKITQEDNVSSMRDNINYWQTTLEKQKPEGKLPDQIIQAQLSTATAELVEKEKILDGLRQKLLNTRVKLLEQERILALAEVQSTERAGTDMLESFQSTLNLLAEEEVIRCQMLNEEEEAMQALIEGAPKVEPATPKKGNGDATDPEEDVTFESTCVSLGVSPEKLASHKKAKTAETLDALFEEVDLTKVNQKIDFSEILTEVDTVCKPVALDTVKAEDLGHFKDLFTAIGKGMDSKAAKEDKHLKSLLEGLQQDVLHHYKNPKSLETVMIVRVTQAKPHIHQHKTWKVVLANIAAACTGVGLVILAAMLLHAKVKGRDLKTGFFLGETSSQGKVRKVEEDLIASVAAHSHKPTGV
ncbi:MAG: hypothetical protein Q8R79_07300 [Legionellaceae bacterium]|nr:hypothetical protein [Legionellaceae bacterium]